MENLLTSFQRHKQCDAVPVVPKRQRVPVQHRILCPVDKDHEAVRLEPRPLHSDEVVPDQSQALAKGLALGL